jgi:hypothetical protein
MDHVPVFQVGDRVRIMQTPDMERRGVANAQGVVNRAQRFTCVSGESLMAE